MSSSLDIPAVALGAVGSVILVVAFIVAVTCFARYLRNRKHRNRRSEDKDISSVEEKVVFSASIPLTTINGPKESKLKTEATAKHEPENEMVYENTANVILETSHSIVVDNYWNEITKRLNDESALAQEYSTIPAGLLEESKVASQNAHKKKCRFKGLQPYDHNRVVLQQLPGDRHSHFINASYFDAFNKPKAYIASQGPVSGTLGDFWRMIWETGTDKIVMLTNLFEGMQKKCDQYWPDKGKVTHGGITVETKEQKEYPDYTVRTLHAKLGTEKPRVIKQLHFTTWPDHHVPDSAVPLLHFWELSCTLEEQFPGTSVIHCSAGVGRTGTYMAYRYLMDEAAVTSVINPHDHVIDMRHGRPKMIQTEDQYRFLYIMLRNGLAVQSATLSMKGDSLLPEQPDSVIAEQFQILERWRSDMKEDTSVGLELHNVKKNLTKSVVAGEHSRVKLTVHGGKSYINAVFVPMYSGKHQVHSTHYPKEETAADFWTLVHEYKIGTMVTFTNESTLTFLPRDGSTKKYGQFSIKSAKDVCENKWTLSDLTLKLDSGETQQVRVYSVQTWNISSDRVADDILSLVNDLISWTRLVQSKKLLVTCPDGVEYSGLFCCVLSAVQRIIMEKIVNPMTAVQETREGRKVFITSEGQYKFLYRALYKYRETATTYENTAAI